MESTLSDDEDDEDEDAEEPIKRYSFPELDTKIRECIKEYGAVFPKLNFSSPKVRISALYAMPSAVCILRDLKLSDRTRPGSSLLHSL